MPVSKDNNFGLGRETRPTPTSLAAHVVVRDRNSSPAARAAYDNGARCETFARTRIKTAERSSYAKTSETIKRKPTRGTVVVGRDGNKSPRKGSIENRRETLDPPAARGSPVARPTVYGRHAKNINPSRSHLNTERRRQRRFRR